MKIVVMGGSFNPPTIAHGKLMSAALDTLHAEKGLFVPVSYAYLKRKMCRSGSSFCLSEILRKQMLEAMCREDVRMAVCDWEYGTVAVATFETLQHIQCEYPDAELYFLMGADKLGLAQEMVEHRDFLSYFRIAMFAREGISPLKEISANPVLQSFADRITIVRAPQGIENISSTIVREAIMADLSIDQYVYPGVAQLLKNVKSQDFPEEITRFRGQYEFLDNLYPAPVEWEGVVYSCVEAAFHASKTEDIEVRKRFALMPLNKIRGKGSCFSISSQWDEHKREIMKYLVTLKFQRDPLLRQKLKETGTTILLNGNNGKDTYWGINLYSWKGRNELGKILMEVRNEI